MMPGSAAISTVDLTVAVCQFAPDGRHKQVTTRAASETLHTERMDFFKHDAEL